MSTFARPHKYGAKRTEVDGISFPSKREAARWQQLLMLERAGVIDHLERQVRYKLEVNGQLICVYVADFRYLDEERRVIVEDVKGMKTDVYRLKKKLVKACLGIDITEV